MKKFFLFVVLCLLNIIVHGQQSCPPNIDFEYGNLSNWKFYTGSCCPINATALGIVAGRHNLTSGSVNDPYGNFPVVGAGYYSLKLGNNSTGAQAERARYFVKVPNGVSNYAFIYKYAIVLEDPQHAPASQPRFEVKVLDSLTNNLISVCNNRLYVSSGSLPGFTSSSINSQVYYLPWTTAMLDLSGLAGRTIAVDFSSGDCALGGHFGYGYVDLSCGLFQINQVACNQSNITLSAPPGYQAYEWRDSSLINLLGTGSIITLPNPGVTTVYNVILKPYPGVGCPDTLTTKVLVSSLSVDVMNDTLVCKNFPVILRSNIVNGIGNLTYSWTPSTGLSCNSCMMPTATVVNTTKYYLSVLDSTNCAKMDSVTLYVAPQFNISKNDALCFGTNTGSATVSPTSGYPPYVYSWNTFPVQTTITAGTLSSGTYSVTVTDSKGCGDTKTVTIGEPAKLIASTTQANVSCYGGANGSATVTASGGTSPYSYSWNTSPVKTTATASGLSVGTYTVTVTDANGCTDQKTVTITQPTLLTSSTTQVNVSCYGGANGSATVTASGGTSPYSYSWNTSPVKTTATASGLSAGIYTVTVTDANGCVTTSTVTITQPTILTSSTTQVNVSCYGGANGTATATASGGTAPYSYSWNTSPVKTTATASGLSAGTYTVTVTDANGCVSTSSVTIIQPALLTISTSQVNVSCYGGGNGSATAIAGGGISPYSYTWNTTPARTTATASGLTAGTYTVTVTDGNGCVSTQTVTITQPTLLTSSINSVNVTCFGLNNGTATLNPSGGTAPYTYTWSTTPVQTSQTATGLSPGTYTCTVTDSKGCTSSSMVTITQPIALYQVNSFGTAVSCYGGANGSSTIQVGGGTAPYSYSWNTTPIQTTNTATGLSAGVYTMTVTDANGCVSSFIASVTQPTRLSGQIGIQNNVSCNGGANGSVSILASGGTSPYSYTWNTIPVQTSSTAAGLRAGTYIGTVTDSKGCTALVNAIITEPARLISTIADSVNILCNGDSTGKAVVVASGGIKPYSYIWNTLPVQTSDTCKRLKAGVTIVTVTDGNGCISRSSVTLTQPTAVIVSDSVKDVSCYNGNDGMIQVYAIGGMLPYSYSWNAFPLLKDSIARNLKKGTYVMSVSDSNGCRKTLSIDVNQPQDISMNFTVEDTSCMYEGKGRATVHAKGGTSPYRFSWNTIPTQYDSSSYALLPKYYTATVTDAHNCVKKDSLLIPGYPDVVTKVTPDTMMCQGDTITLHITGASFYTWNPNVYINKWYLSNPKVYPETSIRYVIYAQDSNGCRDTNYVKVTVIYKNKLYVSDSQQICEGGSVQLRAYGGTDYTWQPSESLDDSHKSDPFASPSQTTVYRVKINQDNCFSEELEEKVVVNKNPVLNLQEEIKAFPGARIPLDPNAQYAVKYEWTPVTGLSCTDCETPTLEVGTTTQYILKATGEGDCSTYDTITIHSMCDGSVLYMANTFTPNGDGNNDYFYPQGTGVGVIKSFRVMNHWGQVVFEARDIPGNQSGYGWNGKYKGLDLPGDVFAYMVEYECSDGQIGSVTGDITLIR